MALEPLFLPDHTAVSSVMAYAGMLVILLAFFLAGRPISAS